MARPFTIDDFGVVTDTVGLEDMEYDDLEDRYFVPCRCSGRFALFVSQPRCPTGHNPHLAPPLPVLQTHASRSTSTCC